MGWLNRLAVRAWLVLLISGGPSTAQAGNDAAAGPSPAGDILVTTVRLRAPLSRVLDWRSSREGAVSLAGASLNERFAGFFEAEVGADYVSDLASSGLLLTGRAGLSLPLRSASTLGSSWEVRLPLLGGYHHVHLPADSWGEYPSATTLHAVSASAGVDATYWTAGRWGLNMRLLAGVGRASEELVHEEGYRESLSSRLWDVGLEVGVSF